MRIYIPIGDVLAFLCAALVLVNPLTWIEVVNDSFLSRVAEASATNDQIQAVEVARDFNNFILFTLGDWDFTYGLALQTIATIIGLISLIHAIYSNIKGKDDD